MRSKTASKPIKPVNTYAAASRRMLAATFQAHHTHIKHIKDVVAMTILQKQAIYLRQLPRARTGNLEVTFDESDCYMVLSGNTYGNIRKLMMKHGKVCILFAVHFSNSKKALTPLPPVQLVTVSKFVFFGFSNGDSHKREQCSQSIF